MKCPPVDHSIRSTRATENFPKLKNRPSYLKALLNKTGPTTVTLHIKMHRLVESQCIPSGNFKPWFLQFLHAWALTSAMYFAKCL